MCKIRGRDVAGDGGRRALLHLHLVIFADRNCRSFFVPEVGQPKTVSPLAQLHSMSMSAAVQRVHGWDAVLTGVIR